MKKVMRRSEVRGVGLIAGLAVLGLAVAGCASDGAPSSTATSAASPSSVTETTWFDDPVDVGGGRQLQVSCSGTGEPAVIYLHGLIQPEDSATWAHAPEMQQRLASETTYCEYERTNVGRSSSADGPIPVTEAVDDLHAVIRAVDVPTPVVLLGGSFGGLIAYTYAGTHPDDVAGVVLLDPTLPDEPALDALLPEDQRLQPDAWRDSAEKIDVVGAYAVAQGALGEVPAVPGTIFVTQELWAPDGENAEAFRALVRSQQQTLIERFEPHETITVDAPHTMMSVVPDEIAEAVLAIVRR